MMKRWTWIAVMTPAMWGLHLLVRWADRLYAWHYSPMHAPPTSADFTRAAIVFWASLLVPFLVAGAAAMVAFKRGAPAVWPLLESAIVAAPYIALAAGMALGVSGISTGATHSPDAAAAIIWFVMVWACVLVGGAVVATGHNLGASLRHRAWGRFALSLVGICAGMFYLFWLSSFIIYIDT